MEVKKTPKADLENKKLMFREIGLIIALAVSLFAFEWKSTDKQETTLQADTAVTIEEEMIPITQETPPPPPPSMEIPLVTDELQIVDNDIKVNTDLLINTEDDKNLGVDIKNYVVGGTGKTEAVEEEEIPFQIVEEKPKFMGGDENTFTKWVFERLVYPEVAKENGIQGRVTLQFVVDTDGSVRDVKVIRGVDPALDKEAVRVVSSSPKWTPGRQRDKPVKVRYIFPVIFQLR
ncbi:MAG TPA: energy transducer TonB [Bacteroidales bacterium]|jgi:protein TonB|nr:energy transducer TonB [Bacteroidales bacterium]HON54431.1 energy transducer TonB [Bacteroidales bacterium]HRR49321.1 energy transducer TonB [Bacteroidales bacterium]HRT33553.1 energy transducer TonB [Bacteroidales bacterium]HRT83996.1 energy transducer TonB [Bacteroidales bacterium]